MFRFHRFIVQKQTCQKSGVNFSYFGWFYSG